MEDLNVHSQDQSIKKPARSSEIILLVCSIVLGILYILLFYQKPLGISYPLFMIFFYIAFLWILSHKIHFQLDFGWLFSLPILVLSATYCLFSNPIFTNLNYILIPILIVCQTLLITRDNLFPWYNGWFLTDILHSFLVRIFRYILQPFTILNQISSTNHQGVKSNTGSKILIGFLISIPLLVVILLLLTSADLVFSHVLNEFFIHFNILELIKKILLGMIIAVLSFSYIWSFLMPKRTMSSEYKALSAQNQFNLDSTITLTILSFVNFTYLMYIIIQFAYMLGVIKNGLPPDTTYAEYARKGFFELLTITLINFTILLVVIVSEAKKTKAVKTALKILLTLLAFITLIILVSAFMRMSLYEAAFGYTYLRILTQSFMVLLFALIFVTIVKIWNDRLILLKPFIIISLAAYMIVNCMNVDTMIAKKNLARYDKTGELDYTYLTTLSYDTIPVLLAYFKGKELPQEFVNHFKITETKFYKNQPWQSWNLSKQKAKKALSTAY